MLIDMQDSNGKAETQLQEQIKAKIFNNNSKTMFILNIRRHIVLVVLNLP